MGQPIERGSGETFTAEHLGPVLEGEIGRHDQAQSFIRRADHIEQQFGAELAGRHVAQFIENQQIEFRELFLET